jgi:hypothetical protein
MIYLTTCMRCGRNENEVEMWESYTLRHFPRHGQTVDLCEACSAESYYICPACEQVHTDDNPCKAIASFIAYHEAHHDLLTPL